MHTPWRQGHCFTSSCAIHKDCVFSTKAPLFLPPGLPEDRRSPQSQKTAHMPEKMPCIAVARPLPGMAHRHRGRNQFPAQQAQAQTKVDILAVHEIPHIKPAERSPHFGWQQQKSGIDPVPAGLWSSASVPHQQRKESRNISFDVLQLSVFIDLPRIDTTGAIRGSRMQKALEDVILKQDHIRIHDAKEIFPCILERLVVIRPETLRKIVSDDFQ